MTLRKKNLKLQEQFLDLRTQTIDEISFDFYSRFLHSGGHEQNTDVVLREFPMSMKRHFKTFTDWAHDPATEGSIIARFTYYNDHEMIRKTASEKFQHKRKILSISNISVKCITGTNCSYQH